MRKIIKTLAAAMGVAILLLPTKTYAQDKFTVNGKADFVSDYIWRGADQNSGFFSTAIFNFGICRLQY